MTHTIRILFALAVLFASLPARAITTSWTNATGGLWSVSGNWGQGTPGPNDTAAIQLNGTYSVTVDIPVTVEALLLGGAGGVQTLVVNSPFTCGQTAVACSVGVNGVLDLWSLFTTATSAPVGLMNHGLIQVRTGTGSLTLSTTRLDNYASGMLILEGFCVVGDVTTVRNYGYLGTLDVGCLIDGDVENLSPSGIVSIDGFLSTHDFLNEATVQVSQASQLFLDSLDTGAAATLNNDASATLELYPGSSIDGRSTDSGEPAIDNFGRVSVIDTLLVDDWATVLIPFSQYPPAGMLSLLSGKLELTDTTYLDDSTRVSASCTLKVHGLSLPGTAETTGGGVIQFAGDPANLAGTAPYVRGTWGFTGSLYVTAAASFPTTVDFIADGGPTIVNLRSLVLPDPLSRFIAPDIPAATVRIDSIRHYRGLLNGLVEPQDYYQWAGGTLTADSGTDFLIPFGATLLLDSSISKTLDGIALVVEGSGTLAGSGVLTLTDSARLASQPTGTLSFETGFEMTGIGDFYNSGQSAFDAQPDTILIDVFVENTTVSRTPGTIDVLSGKVVWSGSGSNKGTITIYEDATLIIYGSFVNEVSGTIQGTGTLDITEALFTNRGTISPGLSPGALTMLGDAVLDSAAVLRVELAGPIPGTQHDQLLCNGALQLGGTLNLQFLNGYIPPPGALFPLLTYSGITDSFAAITGTSIGNGQFLEFDFGPTGMTGLLCEGVSNLTVPALLSDTIWQASAPIDTLEFDILNSGQCPLTFSITVGALNPPSPNWLSVVPSSAGTQFSPLRSAKTAKELLRINTAGGPTGTYTGSITIHCNDPDDSAHVVPLTLQVIHGPDVWDIGGGSNDFANFTQAVSYLDSTTISYPQLFNVYPGTFVETVTLIPVAGASATNTVTFRRKLMDEESPRLQSPVAAVLRFKGADHIIWDGIDITHLGTGAGSAIVDTAGADSNVVRNCTLTNAQTSAQTQGIFVRSASGPTTTNDYNLYENVTIEGFTTAVLLGSATGVVTSQSGNVVSNCVIQYCGSGVVAGCQNKARLKRLKISLSHPYVSTVKGIEIGQLNNGDTVRVQSNEIHDLTGSLAYGINLVTFNTNSMVWVYNNTLHSWNAGLCQAIVVNEGSRAGVHFNSIYLNESPAATFYYGIGGGGTSNCTISNNIIFSDATGDTSIAIAMGSLVSFTSDHNCFYGSGSRYLVGRVFTTSYPTFASWQASGRDSNSLFDLPGFAGSSDLHIDGYYTTCDAQGVPVTGISTDMDEQARNALTPDIGADEFTTLPGPVTGLVIARAPLSQNVRLDWSPVAGALSYRVYRHTDPAALAPVATQYSGSASTTTYLDPGVLATPNLKFFYLIRASTLP
ncbi:right-handed parallel beta-helix repeat-containing protein [candidate division KSB1 bacterium]|nr:right-handed parallel beta-helix repeat-containing protein [candidate division KSB1 bacterium]